MALFYSTDILVSLMVDYGSLKKVWKLLDVSERREIWLALGVSFLSAIFSAAMIFSVAPFLSVLADPASIAETYWLQLAYDLGGFTSQYNFLLALGIASLSLIIFGSGLQIARTWIVKRFTMMRMHSLSDLLLTSYVRQPYEFFLKRHSGDLTTRVLSETQNIVSMFLYPAAELVSALVTTVLILALLFWYDLAISTIALSIFGGTYLVIFMVTKKKVAELGDVRLKANSERYRIANEVISGIKDIKIAGREESYLERYRPSSLAMVQSLIKVGLLSELPQLLMQAFAFSGLILLCILLLDPGMLSEGGAGIGEILPTIGVFAFAGQRLIPELSRIYRGYAQLQYGKSSVDVLYHDVMETREKRLQFTTPGPALGMKRSLVLSGVGYRYSGHKEVGISDIGIEIKIGERIGIVGGSGAGKTSLANVLLGLLLPTSGSVSVDGVEINEVNVRSWQRSVGYVPQDIFLIDASVAENIALGVDRVDIDLERVKKAARIAQIDEHVRNELAQGFWTEIGERGVRLSGGQRQRLGIARALYHDADLLVFDEATSALDNLTEREVMKAIDSLPESKTVILIAHRLSTVRNCDRIVVMENGRVVACGSWDKLTKSNQTFQRIAGVA